MASNETDKFLEQYRRLENVLKEAGYDSVLDYENSSEIYGTETGDKLKLCRIQRNFMVHSDKTKDFVVVSAKQTAFLKETADGIEAYFVHAGDVMAKQKSVTFSSPMKDVIASVHKSSFGYAAVVDENRMYLGCIGPDLLIELIAKKGSIDGILSDYLSDKQLMAYGKEKEFETVLPDEKVDEAIRKKKSIVIVVDKNGKYKGML